MYGFQWILILENKTTLKEVIIMKNELSGYFEDLNDMWAKYEMYRTIREELMNSDVNYEFVK